jgi:hypothetical protein
MQKPSSIQHSWVDYVDAGWAMSKPMYAMCCAFMAAMPAVGYGLMVSVFSDFAGLAFGVVQFVFWFLILYGTGRNG